MNNLIIDLKRRVSDFGTQSAYADFLGVSDAMVSSVISGKKIPAKAMLEDLGYEKKKTVIYTYEKK